MTTEQLEAFTATVEFGGINAAAEKLFISQPAVTHRLKKLEEDLGIALFERTANRALLTEAGRAFMPEAKKILNAHMDAKKAMRTFAERQGPVVIGFPDNMLQGNCKAYMAIMAEADNRVSALIPPESDDKQLLLSRRMDIVFCDVGHKELQDPRIGSTNLREGTIYVCTGENTRLAQEKEITPEQLKDTVIFPYVDNTGFRQDFEAYVAMHQLKLYPEERPYQQICPDIVQGKGVLITNIPLLILKGLVYRPLCFHRQVNIGIAWLKNNPKPELKNVIRLIKNLPPEIYDRVRM